MTYRDDFTLPAELLEQVQVQGLEVSARIDPSHPECGDAGRTRATPKR